MAIDWGFALKIAGFGLLLVFSILALLVVITRLTTWFVMRSTPKKGAEGKEEEKGKGANQG